MRWIVYSNLYVAACGAALTAATYALLDQPPRFDLVAALVFCCTLLIYNLDRLIEPHPGDSGHERWVAAHRRPLWAITVAAAAASIALVTQLSSAALLSLLPAGAVSLGYCVPVVRYRGRWRRLKALPGAKLLLIAGVWTYATALLPMLQAGAEFDRHAHAVLLSRLLFIAAVALPFDLPDAPRDRLSGIVTLPTLLGVGATRLAALALACAGALVSLLTPWPYALALLAGCVGTAGLALALRPDRGVVYFMLALDGMLLLQAAGLWLLAW